MQFQAFLNPFGMALEQEQMRLSNEGKGIENATNLVRLSDARMNLADRMQDMAEQAQGATAAGGMPRQDPATKGATGSSLPDAQTYAQLAQTYQAQAYKWRNRNPQLAERYQGLWRQAVQDSVNEQDKQVKQQIDFMGRVQDAGAMASQSPESAGRAIAMLRQEAPPGMDVDSFLFNPPNKGGLGLQKGPDGQPVWDQKTWEDIGRLGKLGMEQLRIKSAEDMENHRIAQEKIAARRIELSEQQAARREAEARERETRLDRGQDAREAKDAKREARTVARDFQKEIDQNPEYKNYDRYQQAKASVDDIEGKLAKGGWNSVSAADVQRLRMHYTQAIADFKSRAGTKFDQQQVNRLNSAVENLDKWAWSIGKGTPALAPRPAMAAMGVIKDEYAARTEALLKDELSIAKKAEKRGGDPSALMLKGDYQYLVKSGRAAVKTGEDGRKWIAFKSDPDHPVPFPEEAF